MPTANPPPRSTAPGAPWRSPAGEYGRTVVILGAITALCLLFRTRLQTVDVAMVLLAGIVLVAARYRRGPSLLASALSIAAFDFLFVPPYYTFSVHDTAYLLTFLVMFAVALVMSGLTARIREQAEDAGEREARTAALYAMDRELAGAADRASLRTVATRHLGRAAQGDASIVLNEDLDAGAAAPGWPQGGIFESLPVRVAATWALEHAEPAGWATPRCAEAEALVVPLRTTSGVLGIAAVRPGNPEQVTPESVFLLVGALADLAAVAFERELLARHGDAARADVESERLRSALLSSLSHDLRTPLAGIEGAASSLLLEGAAFPEEVRQEVLETILEESRRMTRLVTNLLDMVRVETGALAVRKEWQPLEETLGVAMLRLEERLRAHPVETRIPSDLPLVPIDGLLIEQVFINLLENAAKYTPPGTRVSVTAWPENGAVVVEVSDKGPGVPHGEEEAVFKRFHRSAGAEPGAGSGLGLTICRGIITAHAGRIWLEPGAGGGASVRFTLPLDGPPAELLPAEPSGE